MSEVPDWFGREFNFKLPVEQYLTLCVRLRGTPVRLEEMLQDVPYNALKTKHGEKWSAQEHVGHLFDLETLWLARVEDFLEDGNTLTVADLRNRKTQEAGHNQRDLKDILRGFREARHRLVKRIEEFEPGLLSRSLLHPRLQQPMRLVDHLHFVAEHDDHHLAKIWEMIRSPNEQAT